MTLNQSLLLADALLQIAYLSVAFRMNFGFTGSISQTSYVWETSCDHRGTLHRANFFTCYCFLTVALAFYPWVMATPDMWRFLAFIGCCGMMMAGVTPFFKNEERMLHAAGAVLALGGVAGWMAATQHWLSLAVMVAVALTLTLVRRSSWLLWCEISGIMTLLVTLFLNEQ